MANSRGRNASEPPRRIGNGLDQVAFAVADRSEFFLVGGDVALIIRGIVAVEQDRAASQPCFDSIQTGRGFAVQAFGAGGELGVGAVGGESSFGDGARRLEFRLEAEMFRGLDAGPEAVMAAWKGCSTRFFSVLRASFLALRSAARRMDRAVMLGS